jgi:hypothetical protein
MWDIWYSKMSKVLKWISDVEGTIAGIILLYFPLLLMGVSVYFLVLGLWVKFWIAYILYVYASQTRNVTAQICAVATRLRNGKTKKL